MNNNKNTSVIDCEERLLYINNLMQINDLDNRISSPEKKAQLMEIECEDPFVNYAVSRELTSLLCGLESKEYLETTLHQMISKLITEQPYWMKSRILTCLYRTLSDKRIKAPELNILLYCLTKYWNRILSSIFAADFSTSSNNLTEKDIYLFETVKLWRNLVKLICQQIDKEETLREITVEFGKILHLMVKIKHHLFTRSVLQLVNTALPYSDLSPLNVIHPTYRNCGNEILTFLQGLGWDSLPIGREGNFISSYMNSPKFDGTQLRLVVMVTLKAVAIVMKQQDTVEVHENVISVGHCFKCLCDLDQFMKSADYEAHDVHCNSDNWIPALFSDQDDMWIESLLILLDIYRILENDRKTGPPSDLDMILNPYRQFIHFLQAMEFDESILIDLITSPETCFLWYFSCLLKCLHRKWEVFKDIAMTVAYSKTFNPRNSCHGEGCSISIENLNAKSEKMNDSKCKKNQEAILKEGDKAFLPEIDNLQRVGDHLHTESGGLYGKMESASGPSGNQGTVQSSVCSTGLMLVGLYDSDSDTSSDMDELPSREKTISSRETAYLSIETTLPSRETTHLSRETTLNPTESENSTDENNLPFTSYNKSTYNLYSQKESDSEDLCSKTIDSEELLDSIMACLIRLSIKVEKLNTSGLFPYNPGPLISSIAKVEELYEQI